MKPWIYLLLAPLLLGAAVLLGQAVAPSGVKSSPPGRADQGNVLVVSGITQPVPGRSATIAPTILQPVKEVLVHVGDVVKKGQPLLRLDDEEARATLESRKATAEALAAALGKTKAEPRKQKIAQAKAEQAKAAAAAKNAQRQFEARGPLRQNGSISRRRYEEARSAAEQAKQEEKAANDRLQALIRSPVIWQETEQEAKAQAAAAEAKVAQAQLEGCTVTAPIAGIVTRLSARLGDILRPGEATWGEIIDPSELEVRCDLPAAEALRIAKGCTVEVRPEASPSIQGKVVMIGTAADPLSGRVPVLVRVPNKDGRLLFYVTVQVTIPRGETAQRK